MELGRVVIFAKRLPDMTAFYGETLGLTVLQDRSHEGWVELAAGSASLVLHAIPVALANQIVITDPPRRREETPIKVVFWVEDVPPSASGCWPVACPCSSSVPGEPAMAWTRKAMCSSSRSGWRIVPGGNTVEPERTCGTGIAENAVLPARLADLMASMAAVLDVHQRALDSTDASSRLEIEAYQRVVQGLRDSAERLRAVSSDMAASRTVPMGKHDDEALASRQALDAFAGFVTAKQELLTLLQTTVEHDQRMLAEMEGPGDGVSNSSRGELEK